MFNYFLVCLEENIQENYHKTIEALAAGIVEYLEMKTLDQIDQEGWRIQEEVNLVMGNFESDLKSAIRCQVGKLEQENGE